MNPDNAFQRGVVLYRQGRFAPAAEEFTRTLAAQPNNAAAHAMLALCFAAQQRWPDAQREAEAATALDPENAFAHYARATVLLGRGRIVHAADALREALRLDPHDPDFWAMRAVLAYNAGAFGGAADFASRGLAVDPAHVECLRLRALALNQAGGAVHRAGADESMREALAQSPDDAHAHCDAGQVMLERGRPDEAFGFFREALRLDPTLAPARDGLLASLRGRHPLYRVLLRFFLLTPQGSAVRWVVAPILLIGGGAVLCKALVAGENVTREDVVFGSIFLSVGAVLLLGQPVLNWLIGHKRW